ncbi:hypothetical protein LCGC14_1509300, partial [marine sediment metagenome]
MEAGRAGARQALGKCVGAPLDRKSPQLRGGSATTDRGLFVHDVMKRTHLDCSIHRHTLHHDYSFRYLSLVVN